MKIVLYGKPIPKARARHSSRGKYVITYDPQDKEKKVVKAEIAEQLRCALNDLTKEISFEAGKICLGKVFTVSFNFYLPINSSDSISQRNSKLWGLQPHVSKPDYDNLEKFYLDCLTGIIWSDDSLIVDAEAHKHYSDEPRVEIDVRVKQLPKLSDAESKVFKLFTPKEMKTFLIDAGHLAFLNSYIDFDHTDELGGIEMQNIAIQLNQFALKYATILNKIQKLGDIAKKNKQVNNLIREIDEGKHLITK